MEDKTFGWLTFGGNLKKDGRWIGIDLTTAAKSAVFIAPAGLWITLDAGQIKTATYDPNTKEVCLTLEPASDVSRDALLRFEQSVKSGDLKSYHIKGMQANSRGAFQISLKSNQRTKICIVLI